MKDLLAQVQHLFKTAEGLPEPFYDSHGVITNWPLQVQMELKQVIVAISETAMTEELGRLATWYKSFQDPRIPPALFHIISRCLYDNPNLEITMGD